MIDGTRNTKGIGIIDIYSGVIQLLIRNYEPKKNKKNKHSS